jgi:hypothetical protein
VLCRCQQLTLRLLPAGAAVAGWAIFLPLEERALSTAHSDFGLKSQFPLSIYIPPVAKLWITDTNYYVRRGYPFTGPDGAEDSFVRTYHVSPRGSSLIENLRWRDGKEFPKSIFYALVVDGDLFYPGRALPSIASVPAEILISARHCCAEEVFTNFKRKIQITGCMSFAEMFRHLQPFFRGEYLENAA